jgi:serine/threonine-protein kinase
MADVFLSYKREDAAKVRKLVAALREAGLDTWWDEDIPPSAPWEATIEQALRDARAVVVCWSPASVESENVRSEARVAREDGRLIQAFVKPCEPPLFFGERQGVDLSNWRGRQDDPRIRELVEAIERKTSPQAMAAPRRDQRKGRSPLAFIATAAALLLLLAGGLGWWFLAPARAEGPTTLAVLPFRALNPADANLVDAIWDDTRGAISRNPNLRVIGRQAVEALAQKRLDPSGYRKKLGVQYLLDGSVQHVGDQVRMKLSLTRTSDEAEVWSDEVGGKLDNVFAFQQQIATEVEGLIRGRVAPGGGITSKNIATTGEVYSLFADARAKIRHRDPDSVREGIAILKKALALDPNYAPAWAELGVATGLGVNRRSDVPVDRQEAEAVSYLRRALELAPNLAYAHAALAMVQNFPPELEGEVRKAVALDPNDAETWTWAGNFYALQNRHEEALVARNRAAEIEPFWVNAVANRLNSLVALNKQQEVKNELARVAATGDPVLLAKARWIVAENSDHPGDAIRILLQLRLSHPEEAAWVDTRISGSLTQIGFLDEAMRASGFQPSEAELYRGIPSPPAVIKAQYRRPADFWLDDDAPTIFGRLLPKHARMAEYLGYYDAAFRSSDDFADLMKHRPAMFTLVAPTIAAVLRQAGRSGDADALAAKGEAMVVRWRQNGPAYAGLLASLAEYRAFDGKDDEAVSLLGQAVAKGWIPDGGFAATDIAEEPCFERLVSRPDFQQVRRRIFARIQEERAKVPPGLLAQAYPRATSKLAA